MQHNNTTDDRPDDLQPAALIADTLSASNDLDALRGHTASRALTPAGAGIEATAGPFTRWQPDAKAVTAADIANLAADGTITAYPEGGTDSTARRVRYSVSEVREALGLPPERSKGTPVFIDTATPAEDQADDDQEPDDIVSVEGAARQLGVPAETITPLVESGSVTNWTTARGNDPSVDKFKPATVSVAEVKATMEHTLGVTTEKPDDLATPKRAAWEVGNGVTADDIRDAVAAGDLTDYSNHIQISGSDGATSTTDYVTAGVKVSVAEVADYFTDGQ